ncbi:MAG: hypothetical protein HKN68_19775 [Saprospiraceae bacterium]|nr:hypothetical protein [Saprospiraceae bacterium]
MTHLTDDQIQLLIEGNYQNERWMVHLDHCHQCRNSYESLNAVHESLSRLEYHQPSMRFAKNIYEFIVRKQQLEQQEKRWIRVIQISIFFSMFLIFLIGFYFLISSPWELNITENSLSNYYTWSIIMLLSTLTLWILYGIDRWYFKNKRKSEKGFDKTS